MKFKIWALCEERSQKFPSAFPNFFPPLFLSELMNLVSKWINELAILTFLPVKFGFIHSFAYTQKVDTVLLFKEMRKNA